MTTPPITPERLREIEEVIRKFAIPELQYASDVLALLRWYAEPEPRCPTSFIARCIRGFDFHDPDCPISQHRAARAPYDAILRGGGG